MDGDEIEDDDEIYVDDYDKGTMTMLTMIVDGDDDGDDDDDNDYKGRGEAGELYHGQKKHILKYLVFLLKPMIKSF